MAPAPSIRRNLVLGAAYGYSWLQLSPFVLSLRAHDQKTEIVLLVRELDSHTSKKLLEHRVITVPTITLPGRLPSFFARRLMDRRRLGWLHRSLPRLPGFSSDPGSWRNSIAARLAAWFHSPYCARYLQSYDFLRTRSDLYNQVLLTDVRDVLFQASPFSDENLAGGLLFQEHATTHGADKFNDSWILTAFGPEGLSSVHGRPVLCAGTTLASSAHMLGYLAAMSHELITRVGPIQGLPAVDQGVHNWLYWNRHLPNFTVAKNFDGPVLTLHGVPSELLRPDDAGNIRSLSGKIIPVLHQYDRHPELAARLLARVCSLAD